MARRSAPHRAVSRRRFKLVLALITLLGLAQSADALAQQDDPTPPSRPVKLVFIHHSCGENWLGDADGGLGHALGAGNYFVSDTNYGWGPGSIGDRTDITDWPEWFTGPGSSRIMSALYTESGQNSEYTRTLQDPGGENRIVMFKSCYPNSNLEGSANDPPARGDSLTVANAKAIYNELLTYFATRPDKLFVVITAPPVQDPEYATNARAFNSWLVRDWLADYSMRNVAVWDFYNVLTDPANHHRFRDGAVEYITDRGGDTLAYPSGDDHPSAAGNRKATEEFVPLLNVFYNRWLSGSPAYPLPTPSPQPTHQAPPEPTLALPAPSGEATQGFTIDDFEASSDNWQVFFDGHSATHLRCGRVTDAAYAGAGALYTEYSISEDGWAACSLVYPSPTDWSHGAGLVLHWQAPEAGRPVTVIAYGGNAPDDLLHFEFHAQTSQAAIDSWQSIAITWDQFAQVPWQGDGTARYDPNRSMGMALSFDAGSSGWLRVDEIGLLGQGEVSAPITPPSQVEELQPAEDELPDSEEPPPGRRGLCPGSAGIGLLALAGIILARTTRLDQ